MKFGVGWREGSVFPHRWVSHQAKIVV